MVIEGKVDPEKLPLTFININETLQYNATTVIARELGTFPTNPPEDPTSTTFLPELVALFETGDGIARGASRKARQGDGALMVEVKAIYVVVLMAVSLIVN